MKIAVFVSGGGTNLQSIIDSINSGYLSGVEISLVVASNSNAYAITRAKDNGIDYIVLSSKDFASRDEWDRAVLDKVNESGAQLIVLAGYLSLLGNRVVSAYSNRIINIHPALIPSFCGPGMYGIRPHEEVIRLGVRVSGATVHFVNERYDEGPIILQRSVDVMIDDTPQTLQKRIMKECEQVILPEAIRLIADNRIEVVNNRVEFI